MRLRDRVWIESMYSKKYGKIHFPEKETVNKSYTHNLEQLIGVAGLKTDLETSIRGNVDFATNWALVRDWKETSRYEDHDFRKARDIYYAITSRRNGVLKWIRNYW